MAKSFNKQWDAVSPCDVVEVRLNGTFVQNGIVDDRTSDGAFVWLFDSIGERKMLHEHDGYDLVRMEL